MIKTIELRTPRLLDPSEWDDEIFRTFDHKVSPWARAKTDGTWQSKGYRSFEHFCAAVHLFLTNEEWNTPKTRHWSKLKRRIAAAMIRSMRDEHWAITN